MKRIFLITAFSFVLPFPANSQERAPHLPEDDPELTFQNTPFHKHIMEENKFVIKKYAEHTQECGPWFSHVFNPSHTVVAFIGMMPPSGSNIYRFRVYQKKNTAANTSALDTLHNNWEYIGTYDYTAIEAPWDFDAISFDGKNITIKIKSNGQKPALLISFDFNKKYQSFNEQGTARQ